MGNYNKNKYQINNSSMSSKKSQSFFSALGCNLIRSKKKKSEEHYKSRSLNLEDGHDMKYFVNNENRHGDDTLETLTNSSLNLVCISSKNETNINGNGNDCNNYSAESLDKVVKLEECGILKGKSMRSYPRLSECSLNSDDLMLNTDTNLDQADDDVSKDYKSEKAEPYIFDINKRTSKSLKIINRNLNTGYLNNSIDTGVDELEKNDIVSFDSSRESSTSTQRKNFIKGYSHRPHSFSSPLRPNPRDLKSGKRVSNLSTVDSVDLAWTWISASENANLAQDISNLKLMLLKMRRLLLDENGSDLFNSSIRNDISSNIITSSVFSEPSTPLIGNTTLDPFQIDIDMPQHRQWETMSKDMLIQELYDLHQQNGDLQYQLKEKKRIIDLLQDQQQNYRNYPRRFHSTSSKNEAGNRRIIRSSTFEAASTLHSAAFSQNSELSLLTAHDTKVPHSVYNPITPQ